MIKSLILVLMVLVGYSPLYGQVADPGFARYLFEKRNYEDLKVLDHLEKGHLGPCQLDSFNYYTGMAYYNLQELEESINNLKIIQNNSGFYNSSMFFAGWSSLYLGNLHESSLLINQVVPVNDREKELQLFLKTGQALIGSNLGLADSLLKISGREDIAYRPQWDRMDLHYHRLEGFSPKSYAVAGLLSGIIPGAGKIYSGQTGAGISSFLTVGAMTAIFLENGFKTGWGTWNTLTAAGVLSIFYVGNIYGGIVGIKVYRERFYNEYKRAILLDINIPLRNTYL